MLRRILPYILYAILVVGLIVAIVAAFHHTNTATTKPKQPASATTKPYSKPSTTKPPQTSSPGSATQQSNPSYAVTTPSTSSGSAVANGKGQGLSNTGPGDTAALFVTTVAGGTLAYSLYQRKKLSA